MGLWHIGTLLDRLKRQIDALSSQTEHFKGFFMSSPLPQQKGVPSAWTHRHLLDLKRLTSDEIKLLLDTTAMFKEATDGCRRKLSVLSGATIANLFF